MTNGTKMEIAREMLNTIDTDRPPKKNGLYKNRKSPIKREKNITYRLYVLESLKRMFMETISRTFEVIFIEREIFFNGCLY